MLWNPYEIRFHWVIKINYRLGRLSPPRRKLMSIFVFLFFFIGDALVITSMIVPSHVQRGSDAVLRCLYDLEEQSLYSVKWYKGRHGTYIVTM